MKEYSSRDTRHKFIAERFSKYLTGSVINIGGGGEKHFLNYIQPEEYLELDMAGTPDIKVNLDKDLPLPVNDNRADVIICTDVLEHLEELHYVFREILRISRRYVIISVPNALLGIHEYLRRSKYKGDAGIAGIDVGYFNKFYGLPLKKPLDRHRWFFSYTEARNFFHGMAGEMGYRIVEEFPVGSTTTSLKGRLSRFFMKLFFGEDAMKDLFFSVYWCVLEKNAKV